MKEAEEKPDIMKEIGEKGIRIANIVMIVGIIFFGTGKGGNAFSIIFYIAWLASTVVLFLATKSKALKVVYGILCVIIVIIMLFPIIYTNFI